MTKTVRTISIQVQLGTAFWLLAAMLIAGLVLWSVLGSERLIRVIQGSVGDTFGRVSSAF